MTETTHMYLCDTCDNLYDEDRLSPTCPHERLTVKDQIARFSNLLAPKEGCGFVLLGGDVVSCTNVDDAPWYRFRMDPEDVQTVLSSGKMVAMWHSHPTGPAVPSEGDEAQAPADIQYLIYSVEDEDLGVYRKQGDRLALVFMESPS